MAAPARAAILLAAVALAATATALGSQPGPATGCGPNAALVAVPVRGPAPLLTQFTVLAPFGENSTLAWSFGDGTFLNGSGSVDSRPVHNYPVPGIYNASVAGAGPLGSFACSVSVAVLGAALGAHVIVLPAAGPAPLNVHLVGEASGGTGTYVDFVWSFGDGDFGTGLALNYTYSTPGTYTVFLRVTDSSGDSSTASATVSVSPPTSTDGGSARPATPGPFGWMPAWSWWLGGGLGLLGVVAWWGLRRSATGRKVGPEVPPGASVPWERASEDANPPERTVAALSVRSGAATANPGPAGTPTSVPPDTLRLSRRILVRLARLGSLDPDGPATREYTQRGLGEALVVRQGPLSNVLRRMVAAGLLKEELRYVVGSARRLKAYELTNEGVRIAASVLRSGSLEPPDER